MSSMACNFGVNLTVELTASFRKTCSELAGRHIPLHCACESTSHQST